MRHPLRLLALVLGCGSLLAQAAPVSRSAWLQQALYAYHHPWAAQASDELAAKMRKMREGGPFVFLRGTADLFYRDMAALPATATLTQKVLLNGDAHLGNFACFADGGGRVIFALNDFDEAASGPAAWDLRRLATSLVLVGRAAKLDDKDIASAIDAMVEAYLTRLSAFAAGESPRRFALDHDNTQGEVRDCIDKAARQPRDKFLDKSSRSKDGHRSFKDDKLLQPVEAATQAALLRGVADYARSTGRPPAFLAVKDLRQKLESGVGSLGRLRYWALVEGKTPANEDDVLLELKQAAPASLRGGEPTGTASSRDAQRVLDAMQKQLVSPDPLAGAVHAGGIDYVLREKPPQQADFDTDQLDKPKRLAQAAALAGSALAHAHALPAPAALAPLARNDLRKSQAELRAFAFDYADQVMRDWQDFKGMKPGQLY